MTTRRASAHPRSNPEANPPLRRTPRLAGLTLTAAAVLLMVPVAHAAIGHVRATLSFPTYPQYRG